MLTNVIIIIIIIITTWRKITKYNRYINKTHL